MSCQKVKKKLRSAFAKEDMRLTLSLLDITTTKWRYKGKLRWWIDKCYYYYGRYGELRAYK